MREYGPDRVIGDVRFELSRESNSIHRYRVPFHAREKPTSNSTTTEGELNQPNPNVASLRWATTITGFVDRNHRNQRSQCPEPPLLGLVVLIGWYTHNVTLVQVLPAFVPMQYNTALGFLLCGLGLALYVLGKPGVAMVCGGVATALGALTLVEYVFGADLGIDQLLMEHYITVETSHPGRMAPNTALCFALVGTAILVMSAAKSFRHRSMTLSLLGSLIVALGTVAFFGYVSGVSTAYGWGHLTRMAVHTALGFMVLGIGVFAVAWNEGKRH